MWSWIVHIQRYRNGPESGEQAFKVDIKGKLQDATRICGGKFTKLTSKTPCDSLHIYCFHTKISAVSIFFLPKKVGHLPPQQKCVYVAVGAGFFCILPPHTREKGGMCTWSPLRMPLISVPSERMGTLGSFSGASPA